MKSTVAVVASPNGEGDGYINLARTPSGRLVKKQILHYGEFAHPKVKGAKLKVDETVADALIRNFKDGICDIVQVPIVNDTNTHVEDPLRNIGEVVDVQKNERGVYAIIDARKNADDLGKTLIGASAMMHMDYTDTKTGKQVGPTLLHVAVTNRPYITNLDGYEDVIAASADMQEGEEPVVFTPAEETPEEREMGLDELLAELKNKHGVDVEALKLSADSNAKLEAALSAVLPESGSVEDVSKAVVELSAKNSALEEQIAALSAANDKAQQKLAEDEVDGLIKAGKILPAKRDTFVKLSRDNRELFDALVPEQPIVALSEQGFQTTEIPANETLDADIERLAKLANGLKG